MKILSYFRDLAGMTAGVVLFSISKAAAGLANMKVPARRLSSKTINLMKPLFPQLELERVKIKEGSTIPPNWLRKGKRFSAITFGYTVFFTETGMQSTNEKLNVVMHELVHTDQVRRRGDSESRFAGDYGKGFIKAGNYRDNPLEKEAFDFVTLHCLPQQENMNSFN